MKNSDFLSWFNSLNKSNTKENILASANNIISSLSIEGENSIINKEKYRYYLKVFSTQSEDLLYYWILHHFFFIIFVIIISILSLVIFWIMIHIIFN